MATETELEAAKEEAARYKRDLQAVSTIAGLYLNAYKQGNFILLDGVNALRKIQGIVG